MTLDGKIKLVSCFTEEILTPEELKSLLSKKTPLRHYIGFEISGPIHLGTGLVCMQKVKDFADAGVKVNILLADWHSWINDKLGGDRKKIKEVALGYFKEGLKAAYKCVGGGPKDLNFILGSDLYDKNNKYWETVVEASKHITLSRMKRSISILGKEEGEEVDFAKLIYPAMQVADIFVGQFHFVQAGLDQRKAHVIARQVADKLKISPLLLGKEIVKPVAVHHHLLLGLGKPPIWPIGSDVDKKELWSSLKMSKSKPESAIFLHDSPEEIKRKITKAFCPEKEVEFNPIVDWVEYLIFVRENKILIKRKAEYGGNLTINSIDELKKLFKTGDLHPEDLKNFVVEYLIELIKPAREHFSKGKPKEMLRDLELLMKNS